MLIGTKSTTLNYQSAIDGVVAVYLSATIGEKGQVSTSKTIQNTELYEKNKDECRNDMAKFDQIIFELEDKQ